MSDYTAHDAKRLLAVAISEDQMCGYCTGSCEACRGDAEEIINKVKAGALREAGAAVMGERLETETEAGNWLDDRADRIEGEA